MRLFLFVYTFVYKKSIVFRANASPLCFSGCDFSVRMAVKLPEMQLCIEGFKKILDHVALRIFGMRKARANEEECNIIVDFACRCHSRKANVPV